MATKLVDDVKRTNNSNDQEYYNLYYSDEHNCTFAPNSKATAAALDTDTVFKIVTNQLTNDVQITTTKPRKVKNKVYTNFAVKVKPTSGEYEGKFVPIGFINFYENDLDESSTEEDKAQVIANLMSDLAGLKPEQVSKHMTADMAADVVASL